MKNKIKFAYFGTDNFAKYILEELIEAGFSPEKVVTTPDRPQGRKLVLTPSPVKIFIQEEHQNSIEVISPDTLDDNFVSLMQNFDLFIVASYGKIIPKKVLDLPKNGTLNVHPSLLPLYRGPAPIESMILDDVEQIGTTIMLLDEKMDHGPIVFQRSESVSKIYGQSWPIKSVFEKYLADIGIELLIKSLENLDHLKLAKEQSHGLATYTKKIKKEDAFVPITEFKKNNRELFLKIQAYSEWPTVYTVTKGANNNGESNEKEMRIKINEARWIGERKNGEMEILFVTPEGKNKMDYQSFKRGYFDFLL